MVGGLDHNAKCGCPPDFKDGRSFTTYMRYQPNYEWNEVVAVDVNGKAVFEGDIVLGDTPTLRSLATAIKSLGGAGAVNRKLREVGAKEFSKGKAASPESRSASSLLLKIQGHRDAVQPWTAHRVAYDLSGISDRFFKIALEDAMRDWEKQTQLRFAPRTGTDTRFIRFQARSAGDDSCYWDGTKGVAIVDIDCSRHEIGHAIGLLHEHTRSDRDQNVKININNIETAHCLQFLMNKLPGALCGPYDFSSVMHYPAQAFSCNKKATIEARAPHLLTYNPLIVSAGDYRTANVIDGVGTCQ